MPSNRFPWIGLHIEEADAMDCGGSADVRGEAWETHRENRVGGWYIELGLEKSNS